VFSSSKNQLTKLSSTAPMLLILWHWLQVI